jgi:hypothetical protein
MSRRLTGKMAVVTGGNGGIGLATAGRSTADGTRRGQAANGNVAPAQLTVPEDWGRPVGERFAYPTGTKQPVLVVGGKSDIMFYLVNPPVLFHKPPDAQLIMYPAWAVGQCSHFPSCSSSPPPYS